MKLLIFLVIMLAPLGASSQTEVHFKILPPGELVEVSGQKMRGYLLDEWLKLAEGDAELVKLRADVNDLNDLSELLQKTIADKDIVITSLEKDKSIFATRIDRCDTNLETCEDDLMGAVCPWWPYILAAGGSVLGVVGGALWISSR